ncbi:MAG: hypothetical protein WCK51_14270 [Armatimonadota bacterium]
MVLKHPKGVAVDNTQIDLQDELLRLLTAPNINQIRSKAPCDQIEDNVVELPCSFNRIRFFLPPIFRFTELWFISAAVLKVKTHVPKFATATSMLIGQEPTIFELESLEEWLCLHRGQKHQKL